MPVYGYEPDRTVPFSFDMWMLAPSKQRELQLSCPSTGATCHLSSETYLLAHTNIYTESSFACIAYWDGYQSVHCFHSPHRTPFHSFISGHLFFTSKMLNFNHRYSIYQLQQKNKCLLAFYFHPHTANRQTLFATLIAMWFRKMCRLKVVCICACVRMNGW